MIPGWNVADCRTIITLRPKSKSSRYKHAPDLIWGDKSRRRLTAQRRRTDRGVLPDAAGLPGPDSGERRRRADRFFDGLLTHVNKPVSQVHNSLRIWYRRFICKQEVAGPSLKPHLIVCRILS